MTPTELTLGLPEVTLRALSWGPPDGPLALCLHGFPDTAWTWRHLGPVLAEQGWHVVAPFTRGYAPSTEARDGSYHVGALMQDALDVKALLGDGRAVVIGHDWGAVTSNAVGDHFAKVVSMAVPPVTTLLHGSPLLQARQAAMSWYIGFFQTPFVPERVLDRLVATLWARWSPRYDATVDLGFLKPSLRRGPALAYYRHLKTRPPERYREQHRLRLRGPAGPALYLHGADDGCMTAAWAAHVDMPAFVVAAAGHFLHLEQPAEVNARIAEFLGDGPRH